MTIPPNVDEAFAQAFAEDCRRVVNERVGIVADECATLLDEIKAVRPATSEDIAAIVREVEARHPGWFLPETEAKRLDPVAAQRERGAGRLACNARLMPRSLTLFLCFLVLPIFSASSAQQSARPDIQRAKTKEESQRPKSDEHKTTVPQQSTNPLPAVLNITVTGDVNINAKEGTNNGGAKKNGATDAKSFWEFTLTDAVIAFFTIGIFGAALLQWDALRRALKHNREVERAYLSAGGSRLADGGFLFNVSNHGKTTAKLLHAHWGFCEEADIWQEPEFTDERAYPDLLAPQLLDRRLFQVGGPHGLNNPTVYGRIDYKDI
jgi:hypothetical protein